MNRQFTAPSVAICVFVAISLIDINAGGQSRVPVSAEGHTCTNLNSEELERNLLDSSAMVRQRARQRVAGIGPEYLETLLILFIKTSDCEKRYWIYDAIFNTRTIEASKPDSYRTELTDIIERSKSEEIRQLTILLRDSPPLLSRQDYSHPFEQDVRRKALDSGYESVRWLAVRLLSYYDMDILADFSRHSKDGDVKRRVQQIHQALHTIVNKDRSWIVREAALDALYWYGENNLERDSVIGILRAKSELPKWKSRFGWRLRYYLEVLLDRKHTDVEMLEKIEK